MWIQPINLKLMNTNILIPVTRFESPQYYSADLNTAIKQFQEDISRVYTAGYSYDDVIKNNKINAVHKYLTVKFPDEKNQSKFPWLRKFVDYVFTRDEIYNPFGKWMRFEYMHPLMLIEFADEIKRNSKRERISTSTVASTIFVLFQYHGVTSYEEIRNERERIINKYGSRERDIKDQRLWDILKKSTRYSDRAILSFKPQYTYDLVGVSDYRTFEKNCELLNVKCSYSKKMNKTGFTSVLVIGEIKQLKDRFTEFVVRNSNRFYEMNQGICNTTESGVVLPIQLNHIINRLYGSVLIRDKKLPSLEYLKGNSLIRLSTFNRKEYCHIQSDFYDFNFILASLYLNNNLSRQTLKHPIGDSINDKTRTVILESARKVNLEKFDTIIKENNISTKLKFISSPLIRNKNDHFSQIENCSEIISEVSKNGIRFDYQTAVALLNKESSSLNVNNNSDGKQDNSSDIDSNEDAFLKENKKLTTQKRVEELEKLLKNVRVDETGEERLYGIFTPHGASTHRMTSHQVNLQGVNKKIKRELFIAPKGKCLISADVSGQDITVAANMARKLYQHPELFKENLTKTFAGLDEQINETLSLLADETSTTSTPIDYILDNIISKSTLITDGWDKLEIRDEIKRAVYTFFYGGGKLSYLDSEYPEKIIKEALNSLIGECKMIEKVIRTEFRIKNEKSLTFKILADSNISIRIEKVESFLEALPDKYYHLIKDKHYKYQTDLDINTIRSRLENIKTNWSKRVASSFIYDRMEEIIKISYPGILESHDYYYKYYQDHNLTFPTFLGWQTVASLDYKFGKMLTKNKSYPVQASGAEFIRQWLIELKRDIPERLQGVNILKIVNVIHDQVVLEVDESVKEEVKEYLIVRAKRAAAVLGMDPKTLHIPEVKEV